MTALAVASFDREAPFRQAIDLLRDRNRAIVGLWSPIRVEVPDAPTASERGIVGAMVAGGLGGAAALYLLIWWSATRAYPFNSGGRPLHSWPAFLVAPVEFGALAAAIVGVVVFIVRARLTRLHDAAFEIEEVSAAARDGFVVAVRCDRGEDAAGLLALLAEAGSVHGRVIE